MKYYVYRRADGFPEVTSNLIPQIIQEEMGYTFVSESDTPIDASLSKLLPSGELVLDIAAVRLHKKQFVEKVRAVRKRGTVEYNGVVLDATESSRNALSAKVQELDIRGSVPADQLFWKDATNARRVFQNVAEYRTFVRGALGAIMDRDAAIDKWAFDFKDTIDAATDASALAAMPVHEGQTGCDLKLPENFIVTPAAPPGR